MLSVRAKGLLFGAAFLAIVGTLLNVVQLFVMAASIVFLCLFCWGITFHLSKRVKTRLVAPDLVEQDQVFHVTITLEGNKLLDEMKVNANLLLTDGLIMVEEEDLVTDHHSASRRFLIKALDRGVYHLEDLNVGLQDPLGLVTVKVRDTHDGELLVWPKPLSTDAAILRLTGAVTGGMLQTRRRAQDGTSLHGVRDWAPGDTLRRVHWPSTARLGNLAVVEMEPEASTEQLIILDSRNQRRPINTPDIFDNTDTNTTLLEMVRNKIRLRIREWFNDTPSEDGEDFENGREFISYIRNDRGDVLKTPVFESACCVVSELLRQGWSMGRNVGLIADGYHTGISSTGEGEMSRREALGILARIKDTSRRPLTAFFAEAAQTIQKASVVILVTSNWDDDAATAVSSLALQNITPIVIWVQSSDKPSDETEEASTETTNAEYPVYIVRND